MGDLSYRMYMAWTLLTYKGSGWTWDNMGSFKTHRPTLPHRIVAALYVLMANPDPPESR